VEPAANDATDEASDNTILELGVNQNLTGLAPLDDIVRVVRYDWVTVLNIFICGLIFGLMISRTLSGAYNCARNGYGARQLLVELIQAEILW
jgi:hypothetical protein